MNYNKAGTFSTRPNSAKPKVPSGVKSKVNNFEKKKDGDQPKLI